MDVNLKFTPIVVLPKNHEIFRVDSQNVPYATPFESGELDLNWASYNRFTGGCPSRGGQAQFVCFRVLDLVNAEI